MKHMCNVFLLPSNSADQFCNQHLDSCYSFGPSEKIITDQRMKFCNYLNDTLFSLSRIIE